MAIEWTSEMALALPDDGMRHEVLDGELVMTPAPSMGHQDIVGALYTRLREYARSSGVGRAHIAPADVVFSTRRLLQPDVFVVPLLTNGSRVSAWNDVRRLLLAVEVLSPSSRRNDRVRKRAIYLSEGVPEYWIVDGDARLVERWRQGEERPEILDERLVWQPDPAVEPLTIDLAAMFADALE